MNHHPFHAFTMRDGTAACSQCNAPLSDPVHLPEFPDSFAEMVAEINRLRDEVDRVKTREMIFLRSNGELTKEVLDLRDERDRAWGCNNSLTTQVAMISGVNEQLRTELAELRKDFQKPDQWWDWDDSERNIESLEEWLDLAGMQITGGEVYRFHASRRLPDEYYEVFVGPDGQAELKPTTKEAWQAHRLLQSRKP